MLDDGTHAYLYGNMRLAQLNTDTLNTEYFLTDALGSVRQMVDETGTLTLAKAYLPYGETLSSAGSAVTSYGFTGNLVDSYIKLVYLRSRYYAPETGRFITKDVWPGDYTRPLSLNGWNYVYANPINYIDPSGNVPCESLPPGPDRDACIQNNNPPYEIGPNDLRVQWLGGSDNPPYIPPLCNNQELPIFRTVTRRVTVNIQPKIGTVSFTYDKSRVTMPIPHGNRPLLRSTGNESVAIRTILTEVTGHRYRYNVHGVQEGLGILFTAYNRSVNPAWKCSSLAACFVPDIGMQYAITKGDVYVGWDPLCLGYYAGCESAYNSKDPLQWHQSLDLAATSYYLFKNSLFADFTHGADVFAHGQTYTNFYICHGGDETCDKTVNGIKAHVLCEVLNPQGQLELCNDTNIIGR